MRIFGVDIERKRGKAASIREGDREKVLPNGSVGKKEDELEKVEQKEAKEQLRERVSKS